MEHTVDVAWELLRNRNEKGRCRTPARFVRWDIKNVRKRTKPVVLFTTAGFTPFPATTRKVRGDGWTRGRAARLPLIVTALRIVPVLRLWEKTLFCGSIFAIVRSVQSPQMATSQLFSTSLCYSFTNHPAKFIKELPDNSSIHLYSAAH